MSAAPSGDSPKSLLVVRLGAMGDVIHTLPAIGRIRQAWPDAQIGWAVEEHWAELLCAKGTPRTGPISQSRPLLDFVHVVNTKSWRKSPLSAETRCEFSAALKEIRSQRYEVAIDFQGAIKSALLSRISAAKTVYGVHAPRELPARMFYSRQVPTTGTHVIEQYDSLARAVLRNFNPLAETDDSMPEISAQLPHDEAAEAAVVEELRSFRGPIVLINPGAGWGAKEWPPERYGEVSRALAEDGFTVLVNYGPGEEQIASNVHAASGGLAQPITCSIGELVALSRRASLFIGGDTGPLHLAAALGIPVVAIFGPTDPARNGPYSTSSIVIRNAASRTSLSHTSVPDRGLLQITPEEVLRAARTLLENTHA